MTPTLDRARLYVAWSYISLALLCCFPALLWSVQMAAWEPYVLAACMVAIMVQAVRWDREVIGPVAVFACVLTLAAWVTALVAGSHPVWVWPATFAVTMALRPSGGRYLPRAGAVVAIVGLATAPGLWNGIPNDWDGYLWMVLVFVGVMVSTVLFTDWTWRLFSQLDDAREAAGELAVAEERLRFAADLHDIQGHTLQTIALKSELARRTVERDPQRAATEMATIEELARRALEETREVVHGYRNVGLSDELANAEEVLGAAGIRVERDDASALEGPHSELLGLVVREATTNIIRHARARTVTFETGPRTLTIRNDGVQEGPAGDGTGLAGLRTRLATIGGSLATSAGAGVFEVVVTLREARS